MALASASFLTIPPQYVGALSSHFPFTTTARPGASLAYALSAFEQRFRHHWAVYPNDCMCADLISLQDACLIG